MNHTATDHWKLKKVCSVNSLEKVETNLHSAIMQNYNFPNIKSKRKYALIHLIFTLYELEK